METFRAPLSGAVTQWIAPIAQFGLWNVNLGSTPAPDVEARVLDQVGSYGRQLGRLSDAIEVLVATLDRNSLSPAQQDAISAFESQIQEVRAAKAQGGRAHDPSLARPIPRIRQP